MEWHFKYSPYTYCQDNPLRYIDPLGLDTAKTPTPAPPPSVTPQPGSKPLPDVNIEPVTVIGHRPSWLKRMLNKIGKFFEGSADQTYGEPVQKPGGPGFIKTKAKITGPAINVEDLLSINPEAGKLETNPWDLTDALIETIENQNEDGETPDKDINKQNKTTNTGKPIPSNASHDDGPEDFKLNLAKRGLDSAGIVGNDTFARQFNGKIRNINTFNNSDKKSIKNFLSNN
jgi:hypothetical protein